MCGDPSGRPGPAWLQSCWGSVAFGGGRPRVAGEHGPAAGPVCARLPIHPKPQPLGPMGCRCGKVCLQLQASEGEGKGQAQLGWAPRTPAWNGAVGLHSKSSETLCQTGWGRGGVRAEREWVFCPRPPAPRRPRTWPLVLSVHPQVCRPPAWYAALPCPAGACWALSPRGPLGVLGTRCSCFHKGQRQPEASGDPGPPCV